MASISASIETTYRRLIILEMLGIFLGSVLVSAIRFDQSIYRAIFQYPGAPKILIYPLIWYFCLYATHAWDRSIIINSNEYYIRLLKSSTRSLLLFAAFAYLIKYPISRIWVFANALSITLLLISIRYFLRIALSRELKANSELKYLYIGSKGSEQENLMHFQNSYGFLPTFKRFDPPSSLDKSEEWLTEFQSLACKESVYGAIIGVGEIQDASLIRRLVDTRRDQVIDFLLVSKIGPITKRFESLDSPILFRIRQSSLVSGGAVLKRIFDIAFASLALVLLSPLFLITAVAIKLTSKGPVFYVDMRIGKEGKPFAFPKFRSMYDGADRDRLEILGKPDEDMTNRYKKDPRITPFGKFIRRWSIDETPQFWSVLIGSMSIVGPRPVIKEELDQIPSESNLRFLAKPGLTGLWQVTGRKEVAWEDRMLRDVTYIDNWSLSRDFFLIWQTIGAVVKGHGAH